MTETLHREVTPEPAACRRSQCARWTSDKPTISADVLTDDSAAETGQDEGRCGGGERANVRVPAGRRAPASQKPQRAHLHSDSSSFTWVAVEVICRRAGGRRSSSLGFSWFHIRTDWKTHPWCERWSEMMQRYFHSELPLLMMVNKSFFLLSHGATFSSSPTKGRVLFLFFRGGRVQQTGPT